MKSIDIVITGLGGQGVLSAGKVIGEVALMAGYDVKITAIRGMAQRGEGVLSQIRIGKKIFSPLISEGKGDILLGFELLEVANNEHLIKKEGLLIFFDRLTPFKKTTDLSLKIAHKNKLEFSYKKTLERLPNEKNINLFMLGVVSKYLTFKKELWIESIKINFSGKKLQDNLFTFEYGYT